MLKTSPSGVVRSPAVLLTARNDVDLPMVVEDGGPTWSFRRLAAAAAAVASEIGTLDAGARVAITAPNGAAFLAALNGVWLAGGVPAPVSSALPAHERDGVLETLQPELVVAAAGLGLGEKVTLDPDALFAADGPVPEAPLVGLDEPALILFTSGTTGLPKGVVYSMRMAWGLIDRIASNAVDPDSLPLPVAAPPRQVTATPMAHMAGIFGTLFSLWRGRAIISVPRFEPRRFAELVRTHGVTNLALTPTMMRMLLDGDVGVLAPPAKIVTTGAAPVPPALREEFEARFGIPVQISYGQTETGVIAFEAIADLRDGRRDRPGQVGRVVPGIRLQIRGAAGEELPPGSEGEIWVQGGDVSPRLIGSDDVRTDGDGWLATEDVGSLDADGYLTISGRAREVIIRGGFNIVPAEVERELVAHAAVAEAAVVGVPDGRLGEVPHAWVRLAPGASTDAAELTEWLRARISHYKVPVAFTFVDDFDRTETGKIRKQVLLASGAD
ncbi:MAG: AMP-binding protein [Actinomycetota bacterium]